MTIRWGRDVDLRTISLCSGGAGLDIGLELAIPGARSVCYVEREAFGIARLVEAMQEGFLADAPVWSDVSTFRGRPWRGLVDGVIGGIPCQPHSYAGKREGADDERDLWPDTRRIVNEARPWFVLIENVGGMLVGPEGQTAGAARVRRDLAAMSFRTEIVLVRASEVGASHERARVFILALADDQGERWGERWPEWPRRFGQSASDFDGLRAGVGQADACDARRQGRERIGSSGERDGAPASGSAPELRRASLADPVSRGHGRDARAQGRGSIGRAAVEGAGAGDCRHVGDASRDDGERSGQPETHNEGSRKGLHRRSGKRLANTDIIELRRQPPAGQLAQSQRDDAPSLFPPGPGDRSAWERIARERPDLLPATAQPRVRGMADGLAARVDQLRMLGNGVVPLQAAYAIRLLVDAHARFGASESAKSLRRIMNQ